MKYRLLDNKYTLLADDLNLVLAVLTVVVTVSPGVVLFRALTSSVVGYLMSCTCS